MCLLRGPGLGPAGSHCPHAYFVPEKGAEELLHTLGKAKMHRPAPAAWRALPAGAVGHLPGLERLSHKMPPQRSDFGSQSWRIQQLIPIMFCFSFM